MVEAVTPGTVDTVLGTVLLNSPVEDPLLLVVTIRSALTALSTLLVADFESDAPKTAIAETRASPTISADAVCAVRRGLRMEFSRPSLPATPNKAARGRPTAPESGRARAGASMATPTKNPTAPRPTSWIAGFERPTPSATPPRTATEAPHAKRRRKDTSPEACPSLIAATGGIRTARRAGLIAATTVTPTPTSQCDDDGAGLEHERSARQGDAEAA